MDVVSSKSNKQLKKPKLDSSDESDSDSLDDQSTLPANEDGMINETSHYTLIQSLKSSFKTKRKRFSKDENERDVLDAKGKLILKPEEIKSRKSFLDLFDDKDADVLKQVKASLTQPKKKKVKGEKEKSLSLTTSLEKPAVKRIQREILYNNANKEVSKWNSVVYKNRVADQLVFPLPEGDKLSKKEAREAKEDDFVPMTSLEVKMATLIHGEGYVERQRAAILGTKKSEDDGETYVRTVEEAMERHQELARLRALQSYEMAKAKRQGKIKSKKYHRLQRREKIRKQLKEFEDLQKTDPEAALLKLEELDRARVEERMSLKHRNTSKWAKGQMVRAKYNRESRAELSEQLKISRELTKKVVESSSDSDPDDVDLELPALVKSSLDNPWCLTGSLQENEKVNLYYTGYKRFWDEVNERKERERRRAEREEERERQLEAAKKKLEETKSSTANAVQVDDENIRCIKPVLEGPVPPKKKRKVKKQKKKLGEDTPLVPIAEVPQELSVDDLDELLHKANQKLKEKVCQAVKNINAKRAQNVEGKVIKKVDLKAGNQDGDADEIRDLNLDDREINFEGDGEEQDVTPTLTTRQQVDDAEPASKSAPPPQLIDPSHFLEIRKPTKFDMKVTNGDFDEDNELLTEDDEDEERDHLKMIAEAFDDEDLVDDFERRKAEEIGEKRKEINLVLPGWGEWGGKDCKPSKRKQRKFIKKLPPPKPRRDAGLPHVILSDQANSKLRDHQVKELPFPFTRVADYEKMIRAPIGRTWMPETAMKNLTAPKVITRLGQSIQPISDDVLIKPKESSRKTLKMIK